MRKVNSLVIVLCVLSMLGGVINSRGSNCVPDPQFSKADFKPLCPKTTWRSYIIASPSKTVLNKKAKSITLSGGKTFLHSSKFPVEPGTKYTYKLQVKGSGKVSVQTLWWTKDDGMADPHRTFSIKAVELKNATETITGTDTAPKNAARAYIRIVVENGTVTVSNLKVTKSSQ